MAFPATQDPAEPATTFQDRCAPAGKLMDVHFPLQRWRLNHVISLERVSQAQVAAFLRKALGLRFFHNLYNMRTELIYTEQE
ncbi:hypothetical protein [Ruegeria denitrificans]|nr:hypothetical protein [Ruegeria denitrificans]